MVFSVLLVITGVQLTPEEFDKHIRGIYVDEVEEGYLEINDAVTKGKRVKIFTYPCCSGLNQKVWLVGFVSRLYHRVVTHCGKPGCSDKERLCCEDCIKVFRHSDYDVEKIQETVQTAPEGHFCGFCGTDNRRYFTTCRECDRPYQERAQGHPDRELRELLKAWNIDRAVANYYLLDDCLSCT